LFEAILFLFMENISWTYQVFFRRKIVCKYPKILT
jgi:hypothetical protein